MMKKRWHSFLVAVFLLLAGGWFATSCTVELPSHVISKGKMERILYDYHLAQGMAEAGGGDVEANRYLYVQKVFDKYNITEAEFDTSMVWYSGHAAHLEEMYTHIEARLERESNVAGLNLTEVDQYARYTSEGDTANIWHGRKMLFVHGNRRENLLTVVIPADSTFRQGDTFMLHVTNRFIVQENQREGYVLMQVAYDNDTVAASTALVNGNLDTKIEITADKVPSQGQIRSLTCTFYYAFDEEDADKFRLWVISNPILLRYHAQTAPETSEEAVADTLSRDTLPAQTDSIGTERAVRVSPERFRQSQSGEHKINVVEKRRVVLPASGSRQQTRRAPLKTAP